MGTAASRMSEPLAAASSSTSVAIGSPDRANRASWLLTVVPMSKHRPFEDRYPSVRHRR